MKSTDRENPSIDHALEIGASALEKLRRLRGEIAEARSAEAGLSRFRSLLLARFGRRGRRRRILAMTGDVQADLGALDAAVDGLREAGIPLPDRAGFQAAKVSRHEAPPSSWFLPRDPWLGSMHVVESALVRVDRVLVELRDLRPGRSGSA